jgi:hypothetical protein
MHNPSSDIFSDIEWTIEQEPEIASWFDGLDRTQFGHVAFHIERLQTTGSMLRMPHSRTLGNGLFELRFDLGMLTWRITYFFSGQRRIVLLTVFRKQRNNERNEVNRAHAAMARCISEGHTADEDSNDSNQMD